MSKIPLKGAKSFMHYIIWTFIALVIGVVYMRLLLGNIPDDESYGGIGFIVKVFYVYGLVKAGLLIGGIIATLFILLDALYLKRKLNSEFCGRG